MNPSAPEMSASSAFKHKCATVASQIHTPEQCWLLLVLLCQGQLLQGVGCQAIWPRLQVRPCGVWLRKVAH